VAAIFGAGVQARTQLEAVCTVRPIQRVWVYALTRAHVEQFIDEMQPQVPAELRAATSPQQAIAEADIICAATTSHTPVFADADLKPGTHINGVGSYTPEMIEIPPETLARAAVFVDSRQAVLVEAGEIIAALQRDLLTPEKLTEIGEVAGGAAPGRRSREQITYFKSVGIAVQDAVAAHLALKNATDGGLGEEVAW
jgi:ornithine cyclodeaminase